MAQSAFGAEYTRFAPFVGKETKGAAPTYGPIISLGGLVSATETPNVASGKLDSDNKETLRKDSISSYAIAITTDGLTNKDAATFYGAEYDNVSEELGRDTDDNPPFGGFGYLRNIATEDGEYYKGYFYPKAKAVPTADGANTKGDNITYSTTNVNLTALKTLHRATKLRSESGNFDTFEEAAAWLDGKFGETDYHAISVVVNGAGSGNSVSPAGLSYTKDGEAFTLHVTGTPAALYDNGTDKVDDITNEKYVLASVTAAHDIVVIF